MGVAPDPEDIYQRARAEGRRRMGMPLLEQTSTGFIAGVTIIFGIVALGVVEGLVKPEFGAGPARIAGALAFAIGLVFLVVGRSELFTENFFDPVASAIDQDDRSVWGRLLKLWISVLVFNLIGGVLLVAVLTVKGALPTEATDALVHVAEEIAGKSWVATFVRAVLAGALLTLLSYLLSAVNSVAARILVAYMAGFFLALGPFDHVVVSALHLFFGVWLHAPVGYDDVAANVGVSTAGNLVGGIFLMTLTHTAQVVGARQN